MRRPDLEFWRGRRVLVTGHTGFKGVWLCLMLHRLGAEVTGFALPPESGPTGFSALRIEFLIHHRVGDLRDSMNLTTMMRDADPEIVLHLAAQALIVRGYQDPVGTFATNVIGTLNVLEALRDIQACRACVAVTSDKVYLNTGSGRPFREGDPLGGHDPYSASKAACEIAVASYARAYFNSLAPVATVRAGNVLGGGDFGEARLIPDLVRADLRGEPLIVRKVDATRPFQHVLDVLVAYLLVAEDLALRPAITPRAFNIGPEFPEMRVGDLLDAYGEARGRAVVWRAADKQTMDEAPRLALDSSLARQHLRWRPRFDARETFRSTARWYDAWTRGDNLCSLSFADIAEVLTS